MSNHSHHHHEHHHQPNNINTAFIIGIILNMAFVIVEVVAGFNYHSMALLSDAGHNLADVGSLALSLIAILLMKSKSTKKYTYGYKKTSVLIALVNSVLLLISIGAIAVEAFHQIIHPQNVSGKMISIVATMGLIINAASAFLFFKNKEHDLNVKGAYLHLLADALVSLSIIIAGIIIYYTNWFWLDSIMSLVVVAVIIYSTFTLLKDSVRLSLDGVPTQIDIDEIKQKINVINGVVNIHHIHIWAISTSQNALTAHIVVAQNSIYANELEMKKEIKHILQHQNIQHITLEIEKENDICKNENCS
jgi:cobalt-zinc-cadmium efflux system protein